MSGSGGVNIPISAQIQSGNLQQQLDQLKNQINQMGTAVAAANRVQFNPIGKTTLADLQRVTTAFAQLKQTSTGLNQRIRATGQQGADLFGLDFGRLYPNPAARNRTSMQAFQYVTGQNFTAFPPAPPPPPGAPPPSPQFPNRPMPPALQPPGGGGGGGGGGIIRPVVGSALSALGPYGGLVNRTLNAPSVGAGVQGFVGGGLALIASQVIGAVKAKIDQAGQEGVGYDTLKRQLGDLGVGFDALKLSLRAASDSMSVTYEEAQRLGAEFARISGISRGQADSLAERVAVGGGFARSFGADPSRSNAFFASMQGLGITNSTDDSRRMALLIGEGIAKSGAFARTEELMQSVAAYAGQQTRSNLAPANVAAYAGQLTGMVGSNIPGLDVAGSAAILGRVNGAIAGGGAAGEAGQAFIYRALGSRLGLDPLQVQALQEGGAFGTGRSTFGPGSVDAAYRGRFGGSAPAAAGSDATNLELIMQQLQSTYGGNSSLMASAGSRLLGLNTSQFKALATVPSHQLGGLTAALERNGINLGDLSGTSISSLASVATGGRGELEQQAQSLRNRKKQPLSTQESAALDDALKSQDIEKLRDVLLKLTASRDQQETEGSRTRDSVQKVDKTLQDMADKLVPLTNDMRDAMVFLAGRGTMTARGIRENVRAGEVSEAQSDMQRDVKKLDSDAGDEIERMIKDGTYTPEKAQAVYDRARAAAAARQVQGARQIQDINGRYAPPAPTNIAEPQTGGTAAAGPAAAGPSAAASGDSRGIRNNNPGNLEYAGQTGAVREPGPNGRFAVFQTPQAGVDAVGSQLRLYGGRGLNTLRSIISTYSPANENNTARLISQASQRTGFGPDQPLDMSDPNVIQSLQRAIITQETGSRHVGLVGGTPSVSSTPMPGGPQRPAAPAMRISLGGTFNLSDSSGRERAAPVQIQTEVSAAAPYGAN